MREPASTQQASPCDVVCPHLLSFISLVRALCASGTEREAVAQFWNVHFGVGEESASFERVRSALQADLPGEISSVDLQLLRLELMVSGAIT